MISHPELQIHTVHDIFCSAGDVQRHQIKDSSLHVMESEKYQLDQPGY